jgi:adenosylmethionine-8-amino-7-oxononanoate aminotransferase
VRASRIAAGFERLSNLSNVKATRTLGMIGALDLTGESGYLERGGWRVYNEALKRGAYLRPLGNAVYIAPPLNIELGELDELLDIVHESVSVL